MTIPNIDFESTKQSPDGCVKCHRHWPTASFNHFNEAVGRGVTPPYVCDLCLEFPVDDVSRAIDEAQEINPEAQQVIREVVVTGIQSRKNIVGWRYVTFRGAPLTFTDLDVEFKGAKFYRCFKVPVPVIEAMLFAESIGSFFAEHIEHSYQCQKL